eukprot:CAMPEP_0113951804 /NCGR_PEP_ID=MMETSP1339-20121228/87988_1 /TAXON_ID=94617 /ORGANISM="Fibrocapsa japonica" /LENGTH=167 /DNA_ID=CAMNT_0000960177 /DNA_START=129 /DNA_END=632 /DNA_ORIENTATION=+ /assembly_acc=CAM_ASM_000762
MPEETPCSNQQPQAPYDQGTMFYYFEGCGEASSTIVGCAHDLCRLCWANSAQPNPTVFPDCPPCAVELYHQGANQGSKTSSSTLGQASESTDESRLRRYEVVLIALFVVVLVTGNLMWVRLCWLQRKRTRHDASAGGGVTRFFFEWTMSKRALKEYDVVSKGTQDAL